MNSVFLFRNSDIHQNRNEEPPIPIPELSFTNMEEKEEEKELGGNIYVAYHLQNISFLSRHILTIRPKIASRKLTVRVEKPCGLPERSFVSQLASIQGTSKPLRVGGFVHSPCIGGPKRGMLDLTLACVQPHMTVIYACHDL